MKLKIQYLGCTGHVSSAQWPHVAGDNCVGQLRYRTLQPSWKVLLDSAVLSVYSGSLFFFKFFLFLAALVLRCCTRAFL